MIDNKKAKVIIGTKTEFEQQLNKELQEGAKIIQCGNDANIQQFWAITIKKTIIEEQKNGKQQNNEQ